MHMETRTYIQEKEKKKVGIIELRGDNQIQTCIRI